MTTYASRPGPAIPLSIGWAGLSARAMLGFSAFCSHCLQAYLIRTCSIRSKWPGMNSTCQLISSPILLPHLTAARAGLLVFRQIVFLADDRQILERRQVPPTATNPPHRANFGQRFIWRQIVGIHRPRFQVRRELQ